MIVNLLRSAGFIVNPDLAKRWVLDGERAPEAFYVGRQVVVGDRQIVLGAVLIAEPPHA